MTKESQGAALARALHALEAISIPWALTGSFALAAHGHQRLTHDADVKILAGRLEEYEERLATEMRRQGFTRVDEHTFEAADGFIIEFYPLSGALDHETFRRRIQMDVLPGYDGPAWLVALEDLVLLKLREYQKWGSTIHLDDVRAVLTVARQKIDLDALEENVERHGLQRAWRMVAEVPDRDL